VSDRKFNFSSGPAVLPESVLHKAQGAIWNLEGSGIGVLEHSHRGPEFTAVIRRAEALVRELADVPDEYAVLFLQGGASSQFFMVPMNLLPDGGTADYVVAGTWGEKAVTEARRYGHVHVAATTAKSHYDHMPETATWSDKPAYVHITSNETIHGVQWNDALTLPAGAPVVVDASSDIFSQPIDIARYGIIYAGAQKNIGPAGVTLVIARRDLIATAVRDVPTMLRYSTHAKEGSLYNTPSTFCVYVVAEVLEWIKERGGLAAMGEHNRAKAALLYDYLDASALFRGHARPDSRSRMNVTFRTDSPELDKAFCAEAERRGLSSLQGHRSVGGMRASIYNAFPIEGVQALIAFMAEFEKAHRA
jgi:phosphoserine aminotransferase